jgi:Helix-turn-helix domain
VSIPHLNAAFAMNKHGLSKSAVLVVYSLANRANSKGLCWPGQELLAAESGVHIKNIGSAVRELVEAAIVSIVERARQHASARYRVDLGELKRRVFQPPRNTESDDSQTPQNAGAETPQSSRSAAIQTPRFIPQGPCFADPDPVKHGVIPKRTITNPKREREPAPRVVGLIEPTAPPDTIDVTDAVRARCAMAGARAPTPAQVAACLENARAKGHRRVDWIAELVRWMQRQVDFDAQRGGNQRRRVQPPEHSWIDDFGPGKAGAQ